MADHHRSRTTGDHLVTDGFDTVLPPDRAVEQLRDALGGERVITEPDLMESYRWDQTAAITPGHPAAVVRATDVPDVVTTLRWATEHRVPVVPRGAGTSLTGGAAAIDGCIVLSLAGMNRIVELSPAERLAVVQPGVVNADLDRAARVHGLMYAPDPASYEISTIGGNLATNAGGLRCLKYGVTRDAALGLEVVLAEGTVISTGRRTVKGVVGYDLTGLFVGSEGTLGVITSAVLRLRPAPSQPPLTVSATFDSLQAAARAVTEVMRAGIDTCLLELMDRTTLESIDQWKNIGLEATTQAMLISQCDGPAQVSAGSQVARCFEGAGATEVALSSDEIESQQLLELRRMSYPAMERLGACLVEDVCVPITALASMVERIEAIADRYGVLIPTVGHAGDGNLHPVFIYEHGSTEPPAPVWDAADEVFRAALALGGTITGEHGVGALKSRWVADELDPDTLTAHRTVKSAFDPLHILNPGRGL